MKIAFLAFGGAGLFRYGLLVAQAAKLTADDEISIFASSNDIAGAEEFIEASGLSEYLREFPKGRGLLSIRKIFGAILEMLRSRVKVIHDTAGPASARTWLIWLIMKPFARMVITLHDPEPHTGMSTIWLRLRTWMCGLLAEKVVVHGMATKAQAIKVGIPERKIFVIGHPEMGIYSEISTRGTAEAIEKQCDGTGYVLWFGAIRPNKGLALLPEIFSSVWTRKSNARFVIAGKLPSAGISRHAQWVHKVAELKKTLTGDSRVIWIDRFINDTEISQLFKGASMAILPYTDATQSGVLMIALGLGVPVVATPVGDIPEVLQDGITGKLVASKPSNFGAEIANLLDAPSTIERMGNASLDVAKRYFSTEALSPIMRLLYGPKKVHSNGVRQRQGNGE